LDLFVPLLTEKVETVVDQRLVEVDAVVGEEEAAVAGNLDACTLVRLLGNCNVAHTASRAR
jgi:hypothetical protein